MGLLSVALLAAVMVSPSQTATQTQQPATGTAQPANPPAATPQGGVAGSVASPFGAQAQQGGLNVVVLDPAHGGTDPGARGTGGIRESEIVLDFAIQVRRALELQGFQVVQTRQGNDNPSFDDRSASANAQRGAVFVTLHISSTGLQSTARVYVNSDLAPVADSNGLIPWERAQAPFLGLSRKFGDLVQGFLAPIWIAWRRAWRMPLRAGLRRSSLPTLFQIRRERCRDAAVEILADRRIGHRRNCGGDLFSDSPQAGEACGAAAAAE